MRELVSALEFFIGMSMTVLVFFLIIRAIGKGAVIVAFIAYDWASKYGAVGKAVYFGCWIFMFPVTLGICVCGGMLIMLDGARRKRIAAEDPGYTARE